VNASDSLGSIGLLLRRTVADEAALAGAFQFSIAGMLVVLGVACRPGGRCLSFVRD